MIEYEIKEATKSLRDRIGRSSNEISMQIKGGCHDIFFRRINDTHIIITDSYMKTVLSGCVYSINELITMHIQCSFWTKMSFEEIFKIVSAV